MEEKDKDKIGSKFPLWILFAYFIICAILIVFPAIALSNGLLTTLGLVITMLALFCVCDIFRVNDRLNLSEYYEDKIDELKSEINTIDQENIELRKIVKDSQKKSKTKKND